MTYLDRCSGIPTPRKSLGSWLGLALALALVLVVSACSSELAAPFVQLTLTGLPAGVVKLEVDVSLGTVAKAPTPEFAGDVNTLAQITIGFPPAATGTLALAVRARDAAACLVGTGTATLQLTANQIYALTVAMTPQTGCQTAKVPLTVAKAGDGLGTVTSAGGEISCGTQCTSQLAVGSLVTLTAEVAAAPAGSSYKFAGWSVPSCGMSTGCSVAITEATTVTATFRCSGFCAETLSGQTNTLYAVWGFNTQNIVAVGDNGTILKSSGTTWRSVPSGIAAGTSLRAVNGALGSLIGYAVGDGGTIIKTSDAGTSWSKLNSGVTATLRGVLAAADTTVFAMGNNLGPNLSYLRSADGSSWSAVAIGGIDYEWNGLTLVQPNLFLGVAAAGRSALVDFTNATVPSPTTLMNTSMAALNATWSSARNKLYAVGNGSTILLATGVAYAAMPVPLAGVNLRAIYGFNATTIYAVGDRGNVWKYNGTAWSVVPSGGTTMDLYGIWGNNETDFYIVGQNGTILHHRM